jgi:hypothetical protein
VPAEAQARHQQHQVPARHTCQDVIFSLLLYSFLLSSGDAEPVANKQLGQYPAYFNLSSKHYLPSPNSMGPHSNTKFTTHLQET